MDGSKLHDLNLSTDEIGGLEKAFANNKFRDLFSEYLKEIQDPENRKTFENEIIELEKQRGNDVLLIKPTPHHVLKSSVSGKIKVYINFACSSSVNKMNYVPALEDLKSGYSVSIPYSLSPVRQVRDESNRLCNVYCVVFHPTTLEYAEKNGELKNAVHDTAFSAIENSQNVLLDRINIRESKKSSKGPMETTIIKRNTPSDSTDDIFATFGVNNQELKTSTKSDYTTPVYEIKYRKEVDIQNSTTNKYCKMDALIPNQMIIEVHLPLLKSIRDTKLDVHSTLIELTNEDPKYKLQVSLPYSVDEDSGSAKFNADSRVLTLHLDVRKKAEQSENRTLVEEISDSVNPASNNDSSTLSYGSTVHTSIAFLTAKTKYKLPQYVCNYHKNTMAFTLKVKNVVQSSFEYLILDEAKGFWIKFYSLGSGQFPMYYSMRITSAESFLKTSDNFDYRIEGDNVFVYVYLNEGCRPVDFMVGIDENSMKKSYLNELEALELKFKNEEPQYPVVKLEVTEIDADKVVINMRSSEPAPVPEKLPIVKEELLFDNQKLTNICDEFSAQFTFDEESHSLSETELQLRNGRSDGNHVNSDGENGSWITQKLSSKKLCKKKKARDKNLHIEESIVEDDVAEVIDSANDSVDEARSCNVVSDPIDIRSAYRYSDLTGRSILKKNRSFSESSGDESYYVDYARSYSVDENNLSSDSYSQGSKKTVTFNDVISKKLFSSDISILEQRKRQRRHSRRKAGRASDSENSETENSEAVTCERRQNIREYNESLLSETGSETDLTSSLSESGGETSDDQGESLETNKSDCVRRAPKKPQPVPSSKKGHKKRGKKSARKNASTAKHQHNDEDALV